MEVRASRATLILTFHRSHTLSGTKLLRVVPPCTFGCVYRDQWKTPSATSGSDGGGGGEIDTTTASENSRKVRKAGGGEERCIVYMWIFTIDRPCSRRRRAYLRRCFARTRLAFRPDGERSEGTARNGYSTGGMYSKRSGAMAEGMAGRSTVVRASCVLHRGDTREESCEKHTIGHRFSHCVLRTQWPFPRGYYHYTTSAIRWTIRDPQNPRPRRKRTL